MQATTSSRAPGRVLACLGLLLTAAVAVADESRATPPDGMVLVPAGPSSAPKSLRQGEREFSPGAWTRLDELPAAGLRARLEQLPAAARQRALEQLRRVAFPEQDFLGSMRVDRGGRIYYADSFGVAVPVDLGRTGSGTTALDGDVPVSPFPAELIFHSRPGSVSTIYLDFDGESVTSSLWNTYDELGRTTIPAVPYSEDSDRTTFSGDERRHIKEAWQRVAEDFAPFNVDVTTELPNPPNAITVHVLVTANHDANGQLNPWGNYGGVAYLDTWGRYNNYVWCYVSGAAIGECASHEVGHTLNLTHDGLTGCPNPADCEYYSGHGTGETSWAPIMGNPYARNVTQWSAGEYYRANNSQNDRSEIGQRLGYRADDHGNSLAGATPLVIAAGTIGSTNPETDPWDTNPANKGVIQGGADAADVFSFPWAGSISLSVRPWIVPGGYTRGGNLDVRADLQDANGTTVASSDPSGTTEAFIQANLQPGNYYLVVQNSATGNPFGPNPDGYTTYGSAGQFFISATGGDADGDGVPDPIDNCIAVANPAQCDSDGDGYGNACDGDLNNNGTTNAQDTALFRQQLGQPSTGPGYDNADINCNGAVNAQDTTLFRVLLGKPPGPSGLHP
jgi:hypothetical protein